MRLIQFQSTNCFTPMTVRNAVLAMDLIEKPLFLRIDNCFSVLPMLVGSVVLKLLNNIVSEIPLTLTCLALLIAKSCLLVKPYFLHTFLILNKLNVISINGALPSIPLRNSSMSIPSFFNICVCIDFIALSLYSSQNLGNTRSFSPLIEATVEEYSETIPT